jgi:formylglycine-generating enzyme required for sulfatase activity
MGLQNHSKYKGATRPVENISFYDAIQFCNRLSLHYDLLPFYNIQITEPFQQKYTDASKYIRPDHIENVILNFDANGYRLPFEQEWEIAVRGDISEEETRAKSRKKNSTIDLKEYFLNPQPKDGRLFSGEQQELDWNAYGWFSQKTGTRPVGLLEPIGKGLYDAIGNVFEWCYDTYVSYSNQIEEVQLRLRSEKITIFQKQLVTLNTKEDLRTIRGGSWSLSQAFAHPSARFAQPSKRKSSSIGMRLVRNG